MRASIYSFFLILLALTSTRAQVKIGDNPQNINPLSLLELESTSSALVITRVSEAQMTGMTPLRGALVYNTDQECVFYYNGNEWFNLCEDEGSVNVSLEVINDELVLTDSSDNAVSILLEDLNTLTFTTDAIVNPTVPIVRDNTIVITQNGTNYNFEVGEITGDNIVDSSINGFSDIQDASITANKLSGNVAGVGLSQALNGSLNVDLSQITGTGTLSSMGTITIIGQPMNALFNNIAIDVADGAITNNKMANNAIDTPKLVDGSVTNAKLDKINIPLSGFGAAGANVGLGGFQLKNVAEPTEAQDAATRNYVDTATNAINTLADGAIYVGDATNNATEVTISGDASINNTGVLTIGANAVGSAEITNNSIENVDLNKTAIPLSGFGAATADVSMGTTNRITDLADPTGAQDAATRNYVDTATNAINTLADGAIYVGDATNNATEVIISGDASINNTGVLTIGANAVGSAEITNNSIENVDLNKTAIPLSGFGAATADVSMGTTNRITDLADPTGAQDAATRNYVDTATNAINTLADGAIYVGDAANNATEVIISGDASINNTGVLTIGADAVGQPEIETGGVASDEILNGSIVDIDIAPGAAINGTKISPNFGAQDVVTTTGFFVGIQQLNVPDYVFQKYYTGSSDLNDSYRFKKLSQIETFIKNNKHLPGVTSASQAQKDGFWNLSKSNLQNLEKIEELFLHTIEQEKKIQSLTEENKKLTGEVATMKKEMELIKKMLLQKSNTQ